MTRSFSSVEDQTLSESFRNPPVSPARNDPKETRQATGNDMKVEQVIASIERNAILTQSATITRTKLARHPPTEYESSSPSGGNEIDSTFAIGGWCSMSAL